MQIKYSIVDAFTSTRFQGNPAAVILLRPDQDIPDETRLAIASEFALSETAFARPVAGYQSSAPVFDLRWWTPSAEIDLCGHATLATAHILFGLEGLIDSNANTITFNTQSGPLTAERLDNDTYQLNFPANLSEPETDQHAKEEVRQAFRNAFPILATSTFTTYKHKDGYIAHFDLSADSKLQDVRVNAAELRSIPGNLQILTIDGHGLPDGHDFESRVFAPKLGIDEDPVTGAAHCALAPFHHKYTKNYTEPTAMNAFQASRRTGSLKVTWLENEGRVLLAGSAVQSAEGYITI